jgi:pSer/pThr/pTyr-binding forkhead associated (FHA) protein
VVPKALSSQSDEEDDKTTIESGWEEEASTTVEQGEVAEKIRALGLDAPRGRNTITNVTSTNENATLVDEPTVDDQRANVALSIITPQAVLARLVITQGNDSGQEIEIVPSKSYTIGRAIDNDVVLTDIAVSRKHFDLRHEDGSWVVADRGSGNGTVVNGNIEDQPFLLANGDTIEIGNTSFRFDHPNGFARPQAATYDIDLDEEEPSTVAGKPIRDDIATPVHMPSPASLRAKTVPPPALPRPRPMSSSPPLKAPAMAYPVGAGIAGAQPGFAPQHNLQAMQHREAANPYAHHGAQPMPALQRAAMGSNQPTLLGGNHMPDGMQNVMPSTIPGQGPPMQPSQPMPFAYPSVNDHAHAQMMVSSNQQRRDATSTALVPATPYNGIPAMMSPPLNAYVSPQISRRTKLMLAGAGLSLLAAIATVAIIKGSSSSAADQPKAVTEEVKPAKPATPPKPDVRPIEPRPVKVPTIEPKKVEPTKVDPKKPEPTKVEPTRVATIDPSKVDPKKPEPTKVEPTKIEPTKVDPKKVEPTKIEPTKVEPKKIEPTKVEPKKVEPTKVDPKRTKRDPKKDRTSERTAERTSERTPTPTRVATGGDSESFKSKADSLYRQKKFNDAASSLRAGAKSLSGSDASALLSLAATYEQFGRKYNVGIAGGTAPSQAWDSLKSAQSFDTSIGGAYKDEIQTKLQQIATKAALSFVGAKNYNRAVEAVRLAEGNGVTSSTKIVRDAIDSYAGELYTTAAKEIDTNPDAAKSKLKQIKGLVDSKSPWYQKATKLLSGSG